MMPTDPEARIYLAVIFILAATILFLAIVTWLAERAADRADRRTRILRSQLAIAERALEHWKMTDRQRGYTTATADAGGGDPGEAVRKSRPPAAAVHSEAEQARLASAGQSAAILDVAHGVDPFAIPANRIGEAGLDLPPQHGTLPEHQRRAELIAEARRNGLAQQRRSIAKPKETT